MIVWFALFVWVLCLYLPIRSMFFLSNMYYSINRIIESVCLMFIYMHTYIRCFCSFFCITCRNHSFFYNLLNCVWWFYWLDSCFSFYKNAKCVLLYLFVWSYIIYTLYVYNDLLSILGIAKDLTCSTVFLWIYRLFTVFVEFHFLFKQYNRVSFLEKKIKMKSHIFLK